MANNMLMTQEQGAIEEVKRLANIVLALRNDVFKQDLDYGVIPGTGTKPTLLLPGMEKLMRALHLRAEYVEKSKVEDFDAGRIYYRYECRLIDYENGQCIATAIGSANSYESKWRWREQKRTCPKCGKETINRSKFPPKGAPQGTDPGWYCYAKTGGCGAEFSANDPQIVSQQIGRIENPDIFDQMNTIDKIAQKRALGSAIKGAANVSEFFTVDLDDFQNYDTVPLMITREKQIDSSTGEIVQGKAVVVETPPPATPASNVTPLQQPAPEPKVVTGNPGDVIDALFGKRSESVNGVNYTQVTSIQKRAKADGQGSYYLLHSALGNLTAFSTSALAAAGLDVAVCAKPNAWYDLAEPCPSVPYLERKDPKGLTTYHLNDDFLKSQKESA